MEEIIYCKKCHMKKRSTSYESAVKELENINDNFEVIDKCTSSCGLGKKKYFIQRDDELIIVDTLEELIDNLKE